MPRRPFPQHVDRPGAAIYPNQRTRAQLDDDVRLAYGSDELADSAKAGQRGHFRAFARATGGDPRAIQSGFQIDGMPSKHANYFSTFFAAPFGVATMLAGGQQAWLNAIYDAARDVQQDDYEDSVTLPCLLATTGAW